MDFVAIDGEGVTDENGVHKYVMISIGEITLMSNDGKHHECFGCKIEIKGNIIAVPCPRMGENVSNYYHPACYYRYGPIDRNFTE